MNPINRRGQKVVCIALIEVYFVWGQPTGDSVPKRGKVYTVSDFVNTGIIGGAEYVESHGPGITLAEVPTVACDCCSKVMGWPIGAFRPLDERKTDISTLVEASRNIPTTGLDADLIRSPYVAEPVE